MPASRRFHSKSRNGCVRCKTRHVKCDEGKPACSNCQRQGTSCTYPEETASGVVPPTPSLSEDARQNSDVAGFVYDGLDLLLMNHFSTTTALELFPTKEASHIWQHILPEEGSRSPLLMHGMLALAGLDMAQIKGASTPLSAPYRTRALHHQQRGLALFQAALQEGSNDKIHAIFVFSLILLVLAFASVQTETRPPSLDGILDLFGLFRGNRTLAQLNWSLIKGSHIYRLLYPEQDNQEFRIDKRLQTYLEELEQKQDDQIYKDAVHLLAETVLTSTGVVFDSKAVGRWPSMMAEPFWDRLKAHKPEALVILAHYSLTLRAFRGRWWIGSWDQMLLSAVDEALAEEDKIRLKWSVKDMLPLLEMNTL